jgi:membrane protease YdiL (CAAX protease family)
MTANSGSSPTITQGLLYHDAAAAIEWLYRAFDFDTVSASFPLVGSTAGGWLRFKTGSLLVPILGHSLANVAFHVAGGLVT